MAETRATDDLDRVQLLAAMVEGLAATVGVILLRVPLGLPESDYQALLNAASVAEKVARSIKDGPL